MLRRGSLIALTAALLSGCGSQGPAMPSSVPAKGVLLLPGGAPLAFVRVKFKPKDPAGVEAFADTDKDGRFVLNTYKVGDGAVPGQYVVSIEPYDYKDRSGSPKKNAAAGQIPRRYLEDATSDLTVEVAADKALEVRLKP
jgi:hypothetical protein